MQKKKELAKGIGNLRPFGTDKLSVERQREIQRMGGAKFAENSRRAKTLRDGLKTILSLDLPEADKDRKALELLGIDPSWANALNLAAIKKAKKGDIDAQRYVRDTSGEKPADEVSLSGRVDLSDLTDAQLQAMANGDDSEPDAT